LGKETDENVGVEPDHRCFARGAAPAAPLAAASVISTMVTGRWRLDLMMPRKGRRLDFRQQDHTAIRMHEELDSISWPQPQMFANSFRDRCLQGRERFP